MTGSASDLLRLAGSDAEVGVFSAAELTSGASPRRTDRDSAALLYGFRDCPAHHALLRESTGLSFARVSSLPSTTSALAWTSQAAALAPALAGMELTLRLPPSAFSSFALAKDANPDRFETLATLDGRPWFLRVPIGDAWVYVLGMDQIPSPDIAVTGAEHELPLVTAAIALLVFVRRHYPAHAWFSPETFGNFVIDDPLLRPSYGFVRHERLAAQVKDAQGAATIAFIPWNARRSAQQTAELYKNTQRLSVCVHGYEHINDEFSTQDVDDLHWRAQSAIAAMGVHRELTGLDFEPVMIFPQGKFSRGAMDALARAGFLAAANSTFLATDAGGLVRLGHLLEPAVTAYGPVPLFRRRAPAYLNRFRYDVVIGKPLLLVEHHEYFRDQGAAFSCVFDHVRQIAPSTQWIPLGEIARRVHLARKPREGEREIRFYSREFWFRPSETCTYYFAKREASDKIVAVRLDGRPIDFAVDKGTVRFSATLERTGRDVDITVESAPDQAIQTLKRGRSSRLSVAVRRYLAEGRDNFIATSGHMRSGMTLARKLLRV